MQPDGYTKVRSKGRGSRIDDRLTNGFAGLGERFFVFFPGVSSNVLNDVGSYIKFVVNFFCSKCKEGCRGLARKEFQVMFFQPLHVVIDYFFVHEVLDDFPEVVGLVVEAAFVDVCSSISHECDR